MQNTKAQKTVSILKVIILAVCLLPVVVFAQKTIYKNEFDYKNINRQTFVPVSGFNDTQQHQFTILKHSFELKNIVSNPNDTLFTWNGLKGRKTIYSKDSLILFFVRPNDTISRPCILLTHGNNNKYKSEWSQQMNFYAIDLAMRGFCVAYYQNPTSFETFANYPSDNTRKSFYNGFQAAVAADIYITQNAGILNIDTTKIIAGGLSFGAWCSLSLTTADNGINFIDTLFASQGNFASKSIYNRNSQKNIKRAFSIGGGLPKDDTTAINNSKMGNFIDGNDNDLSVLFLHGYNDNLVTLDQTKFGTTDVGMPYFYVEGPRALVNNIQKNNFGLDAKLIINCKGGHPFINSVCGYSQPNCIQQYQWPYLTEPPTGVTSASSYFTNAQNNILLRYFIYMMTQVDDVSYMISDFLEPLTNNTNSELANKFYFAQPRDSFVLSNPNGHYIFRNTDCDGNSIITSINKNVNNTTNIKVYPNPANGLLTIESKKAIDKLIIYSVLGERIEEISTKGELNFDIDVNKYADGNYLVFIKTKDDFITKKIMVIH